MRLKRKFWNYFHASWDQVVNKYGQSRLVNAIPIKVSYNLSVISKQPLTYTHVNYKWLITWHFNIIMQPVR